MKSTFILLAVVVLVARLLGWAHAVRRGSGIGIG